MINVLEHLFDDDGICGKIDTAEEIEFVFHPPLDGDESEKNGTSSFTFLQNLRLSAWVSKSSIVF